LIENEFLFDTPNQVLTKPKQHSFDYNVYMKCFIHELRTPITTISLGLHILKRNITDAENQQTIADVNKSVVFIENILTKFASVQDGNIVLNVFKPFSLSKLILNVEILILYNFKDSGVSFAYNLDPDVKIWNYGDVHNIKHVIINLLKNAIKYRDNARENTINIHITASQLVRQDTENETKTQTVYISVCDVNNHLLPHIKEHLFESFNSTSGSGMGLYICKNIVELHGGTISHNFIEPVGNEFVFSLPLTVCHDSSLHLHTPVSNMVSRKSIKNNAQKYKVLLVDDSMLNLKMMHKILKTVPIFTHIYTAEDGADALNKIKNHLDEIGVVLLDKNMPVMDGWESVKHMRTTLSYNKLVIGLTGEDSPEEIEGFTHSGADYVIVKPLDHEKIQRIHLFLIKYGTDRPPDKTIQMVNGQLEWM
jgi:two-component system CheB/CheR fusion protein